MSEITEITPAGVKVTNGKEYPVDLIVCATGFDASMKPHFDIIGENGLKLGDGWDPKSGPPGYLGRSYRVVSTQAFIMRLESDGVTAVSRTCL